MIECSCIIEFIIQVGEERSNARLCRAFYLFFKMCLINSMIQEHESYYLSSRFYLSYDIKITLISHFLCEKVKILSS